MKKYLVILIALCLGACADAKLPEQEIRDFVNFTEGRSCGSCPVECDAAESRFAPLLDQADAEIEAKKKEIKQLVISSWGRSATKIYDDEVGKSYSFECPTADECAYVPAGYVSQDYKLDPLDAEECESEDRAELIGKIRYLHYLEKYEYFFVESNKNGGLSQESSLKKAGFEKHYMQWHSLLDSFIDASIKRERAIETGCLKANMDEMDIKYRVLKAKVQNNIEKKIYETIRQYLNKTTMKWIGKCDNDLNSRNGALKQYNDSLERLDLDIHNMIYLKEHKITN